MAKKTYKVVGAFPVLGENRPGSTFTAELDPEQERFMLETGQLEIQKGKGDKADAPEKVPCPACVEQGLKQPPKFDELDGLLDHYAEKHPALVPPAELPTAAGEEE